MGDGVYTGCNGVSGHPPSDKIRNYRGLPRMDFMPQPL